MRVKKYRSINLYCFIVILLFLTELQIGYAQRNLKYKDVYKAISSKSKEEVYSTLLVFQKQDPYFANTYFQLGLISQFWSKDYDALTNLKDVELFIYNTKLYFGLANSKINEKEIRKNDKYYLNEERFKNIPKLSMEDVKAFIGERLIANEEYKKNIYIVTDYFNKSINFYNNCVNIFKDINTRNNKIKDIYMSAGEHFFNQLEELERSFDSTIYYLQNYQTALKNYPIKDYNQRYKLLPIETYRLHGLTSADFLQDEIPLWDYGTWVNDVNKVLNGDIINIRRDIAKADDLLNENVNLLRATKEYKDDFGLKRIAAPLKFKIGKYDHKSILLEFFKFREKNLHFLELTKKAVNNPLDSLSDFSLVQKARFYQNLLEEKKKCDSVREDFKQVINSYDINKYNEFFKERYNGETGLKGFIKDEEILLNRNMEKSMRNYRDFIIAKNTIVEKNDSILYNKNYIYLKRNDVDFSNMKKGVYYVRDYIKNDYGEMYITGYVKKTSVIQPFIANTDIFGAINWLKIIPTSGGSYIGNMLVSKGEGCELLASKVGKTAITNIVYRFDNSGKLETKIPLSVLGFPRYFVYDDINERYLIATKGLSDKAIESLDDQLVFAEVSISGKNTKWKRTIDLKGQLADIVKLNNNYYLLANFTEYANGETVIKSKAGTDPLNTNSLIIVIDNSGTLVDEIALYGEKPFFATNIIKPNSNNLNIVGFNRNLIDFKIAKKEDLDKFLYILIDTKGNVVYNNANQ